MTEERGRFVCPWCGASFARRRGHVTGASIPTLDDEGSLEGHWQDSPECSANRNVNNPTAEKDLEPPRVVTVDVDEGEALLEGTDQAVRNAVMRAIVDDAPRPRPHLLPDPPADA